MDVNLYVTHSQTIAVQRTLNTINIISINYKITKLINMVELYAITFQIINKTYYC